VSALEGQGRPLTILNGLLAGRTDESVAAWETLVGTDRDEERDWIVPLLAAGILGIDPDAERGRLRLRLHVPAAWLRWGAENIRIGDAAVGLRIERSAARIAITAEQSSGALPLTLILEPTVHAPVEQCFVDGQPADLALRPLPDRVIVPVQLALDAPRELRIELATG
jgi:hypothetical protein